MLVLEDSSFVKEPVHSLAPTKTKNSKFEFCFLRCPVGNEYSQCVSQYWGFWQSETSRGTKHPKNTQQSWLLQHSHSVTKHFQTLHQGRLCCGTLRHSHQWKQYPFLFPCDFSALWYEDESKSAAFTGELEPQRQRSHSCPEHKSPQHRVVDAGILVFKQDSYWHQSTQTCSSKQLLQTHRITNKYFPNYILSCYTLRQFLQKVILWLCLFKANYVLVSGSRQEKELIKAENGE